MASLKMVGFLYVRRFEKRNRTDSIYLKIFKIIYYNIKSLWYANTWISMTSLDQNVSIIFMNNVDLKIFLTIWQKKLHMEICYISKSSWVLTIFLVWFLC